MSNQSIKRALWALLLGILASLHAHAAADIDSAARLASELNALAGPSTETKAQFMSRAEPTYRRLAATDLMAQTLIGPTWNSLSSAEREEFTALYGRLVMASLYGAFAASRPAQLAAARGGLVRASRGPIKQQCEILSKTECVFYAAEFKANDIAVEHRLLETDKGWSLVDLAINKVSVHVSYQTQFQEALKISPGHMLQKLRELVARQ